MLNFSGWIVQRRHFGPLRVKVINQMCSGPLGIFLINTSQEHLVWDKSQVPYDHLLDCKFVTVVSVILEHFEGEFHSQLVRSTTPHTKPTYQTLVPPSWSWPPVKNPDHCCCGSLKLIQYFLTSYFTVHLVLFSIYIPFINWCSCMFAVQLSTFTCNNVFISILYLRIPTRHTS